MSLSLRLCTGLLLLSGIHCHAQAPAETCLSYEPAVVSLYGTLVRKMFAGPPNYQDVRRGDKAETVWLLELDAPICINENKAGADLNPGQKNIHRVQLVLEAETYGPDKAHLGKRVVAKGGLFAAHDGHHHAPVLLTVKSIEEAQQK